VSELIGYGVLIIVIGYQLWDKYKIQQIYERQLTQMRYDKQTDLESWELQRNDLYDRLSANSFQEYKSQAIRMTKAQNKAEPEHPQLELL